MQKLTYVNLRLERVELAREPLVLARVKGLGSPGVTIKTAGAAFLGGDLTQSLLRQSREIDATVTVRANSREELYGLRAELCARLSPERAFDGENRARLYYENDAGCFWTWAIPEGGPEWGARIQNAHPNLKMSFHCESPFWYGAQCKALLFGESPEGLSLPFILPLRLGKKAFSASARSEGQCETPVTVTVWGKGETPSLLNQSTGAQLRLISPLPDGDVLTLCTDPRRLAARVTHPDGTEENAFGLLDPVTPLSSFTLRAGDNQVAYLPAGESAQSRIRLEWYDCYEGV